MKDDNVTCLRKYRNRNYIYAPVRKRPSSMLLINNHLGHFQADVGGAFREDLRSSLSPSTDHNCQMQSTHQQTTETACKYLPCEKYSGLLVYVIMVMLFLLSIVLVMFMSILTPKRGKMDKICKVKLLNPFVQIDCTLPPH